MATRRTAKASRAIREIISTAILLELNDPRIKNVTILDVEVATDMRSAKVYASVLGDEKTQELTMHGLNSSRGFLQKLIADRLTTRYIPILTFVLDDSVKKSVETARILKLIAEERGELATDESSDVPPESPGAEQDDEQ
ncbi:MAG: 30S ribosome-binding factor RbfA [Planctomycetaceae bacterium]|nr:30S ribosome-binding factor RbfA [Planctomycetaceae bacterium]